jgi:hypothetical protein
LFILRHGAVFVLKNKMITAYNNLFVADKA